MSWPPMNLTPWQGVGPFEFGFERPRVHDTAASHGLGMVHQFKRGDEVTDYFGESDVQFIFGVDLRLAAVQFAVGTSKTLTFSGRRLTDPDPANSVLRDLARHGDVREMESGCSFLSSSLGIVLWRTSRLQRRFASVLCASNTYVVGYDRFKYTLWRPPEDTAMKPTPGDRN